MIFDDGSTLNFDGNVWSSTPATDYQTMIVPATSDASGPFAVLNQFAGLATQVAGTISTLQAQADSISGNQAARELARYQQTAQLNIAKAQTDLQLAKARAALTGGAGISVTMLLVIGAVAYFALHKK